MSEARRKASSYSTDVALACGRALLEIGRTLEADRDNEFVMVGFSVRGPAGPGGEYLATLRAQLRNEGKQVGFHSAFSLPELIRGIEARVRLGTMKWRPDEFDR